MFFYQKKSRNKKTHYLYIKYTNSELLNQNDHLVYFDKHPTGPVGCLVSYNLKIFILNLNYSQGS